MGATNWLVSDHRYASDAGQLDNGRSWSDRTGTQQLGHCVGRACNHRCAFFQAGIGCALRADFGHNLQWTDDIWKPSRIQRQIFAECLDPLFVYRVEERGAGSIDEIGHRRGREAMANVVFLEKKTPCRPPDIRPVLADPEQLWPRPAWSDIIQGSLPSRRTPSCQDLLNLSRAAVIEDDDGGTQGAVVLVQERHIMSHPDDTHTCHLVGGDLGLLEGRAYRGTKGRVPVLRILLRPPRPRIIGWIFLLRGGYHLSRGIQDNGLAAAGAQITGKDK